jgi:hypothetical protein
VPKRFAFPTAGDLRWRPFIAGEGAAHTSLLDVRDDAGKYLGDAVACTELKTGGKTVYVCFNLLDSLYAEALLYDVLDYVARLAPAFSHRNTGAEAVVRDGGSKTQPLQ